MKVIILYIQYMLKLSLFILKILELDERMNERGQEYNHMLNIQSKRVIQV
jgi:hypothetical protein